MLDLSKLNDVDVASDGVWIELLDPATDLPIEGVKILVLGIDSREFQEADKERRRRVMERVTRRGMTFSPEQTDAEDDRVLATCVKDWKGISSNGAALPCSKEHVLDLFRRSPAFKQQINLAVGNRMLFLRRHSTS